MENKYGFGDKTAGNNSVSNQNDAQLKGIKKSLPLRRLTTAQWESWQHNGYVVIPNAIDAVAVEESMQFLWEFQEMSPKDPTTWYQEQRKQNQMVELNNSGMVECYHHQLLWNNRQNPGIYDVFVDIWDKEELWVTIDRANLNPPNRDNRAFEGFIHWDADTSLTPLPVNVQGVLALSDTDLQTRATA